MKHKSVCKKTQARCFWIASTEQAHDVKWTL